MESSKRLSADVPHCTEILLGGFCQTGTSGQHSEETKLNWAQNLFKAACHDCDIALKALDTAGCPL
jgi:hypothetical protein